MVGWDPTDPKRPPEGAVVVVAAPNSGLLACVFPNIPPAAGVVLLDPLETYNEL